MRLEHCGLSRQHFQLPPTTMNSLLAESHRDRISIVLVSPRNPLNIGAAARAMANFGFSRLAVVAPFEANWREAKSAVGASDLLQNARNTEALADAIADCTLVVGTGSIDHRKPEQPIIPLPELALLMQQEFARGGCIALVFGSEKRGLTQKNLAHCQILTVIPTDPQQPSMNLGQAVAVSSLRNRLAHRRIRSCRRQSRTSDRHSSLHPRSRTHRRRRRTNHARRKILACRHAQSKPPRSRTPLAQAEPNSPRCTPHPRILPSHSVAPESLGPALNSFPASSASWLPLAKFHGEPSINPDKVGPKAPQCCIGSTVSPPPRSFSPAHGLGVRFLVPLSPSFSSHLLNSESMPNRRPRLQFRLPRTSLLLRPPIRLISKRLPLRLHKLSPRLLPQSRPRPLLRLPRPKPKHPLLQKIRPHKRRPAAPVSSQTQPRSSGR